MTTDNGIDELGIMSPEDKAVLDAARQMNQKQTTIIFDTIKFKDSERKVEGLTRGHYFIETYDSSKPDGERKISRDIGANPEVVIIHRAYTYSYYVDGKGVLAWTSDIQGFTSDDYAFLFSRKEGEKASVEFAGNYQQLKAHIEQNYVTHHPDGRMEKLMTFQNLLYVLFEGKIYRMFVSNASTSGIPAGQKSPDFKNPQPLSLLSFIETTKQENAGALCEFICQLGSFFKDDVEQPYYIRTFTNIGKAPETILLQSVKELKVLLLNVMKEKKDIQEHKSIGALREEGGIPEIDYNDMTNRPKVEDLPF